jgi:hypothetical protein
MKEGRDVACTAQHAVHVKEPQDQRPAARRQPVAPQAAAAGRAHVMPAVSCRRKAVRYVVSSSRAAGGGCATRCLASSSSAAASRAARGPGAPAGLHWTRSPTRLAGSWCTSLLVDSHSDSNCTRVHQHRQVPPNALCVITERV